MKTRRRPNSRAPARTRSRREHEVVVIANRLPVARVVERGKGRWETSPGGLVSALTSVLQEGCTWVGWTGSIGRAPRPFRLGSIDFQPVGLSSDEVNDFYEGFANSSLWPLYHDAVRTPEFRRRWWRPYVAVNQRFAKQAARVLAPGGFAWVHDYHLQLVPQMLRALRPDARIGFFMHIPFPPAELFVQLPWRSQILEGLLGADLVGFQTAAGAGNFTRLAQRFHQVGGTQDRLRYQGRTVRVGAFPISIDARRFGQLRESPIVQKHRARLLESFQPRRTILLGVDRLDYTKGIDRRLKAFDTLLDMHPELVEQVVFVQIAVPSRERVSEYAATRETIEALVGRINGRHGQAGIVPVHYMYRSLPVDELVAYYLAADVMVVTPLRDGMNLVAKEYVACRPDHSGALILSEFTGSAQELHEALVVNPHDVDGLAAAFEGALNMPDEVGRARMKAMYQRVRRHDVHRWAANFLKGRRTRALGGVRR